MTGPLPAPPSVWSRRRFGRWALGLIAGAAAPWARMRAGETEDYEVVVLRDQMVRMRDGVRLATDVYLPARNGKPVAQRFAVILERTPYGKTLASRSERTPDNPQPKSRAEVAEFFVRRGYAVIYQDCRGRYGSEGTFVKYLADGNDGYDTCAWILKQAWSNGRIGTMGLSYAAHTQGALGSAGAPGVKAMFLDSGGFANAYQGGIRQGGAFELKQATWAFSEAAESPQIRSDPKKLEAYKAIDIKRWFARLPWHRGDSPLALAPDYENYLFEQWQHGNFDAYWKQLGIYAEGFYDRYCDAAMVHMSSWFDPYPRTATQNYLGLKKHKRGPVRLILGPWTHGDRQLTYAGDVDFGAEATVDGHLAPDFLTLRLRWFDRWLKGSANGVDAEAPVRPFVMGGGSGRKNAEGRMQHGGRWRNERDWPLPGMRLVPHYFHPDGALTQAPPQADAAHREYRYDPKHPVPTIGGTVTSGKPVMVGGAFDQREAAQFFGSTEPYRALAEREDVLVFQTEPLHEDLEVTGPLLFELWVSSDAPDTDFTAKLIDVYPPNEDYPHGYAMNLTDGILRMRYRDSWEKPAMMKSGEIYKIRIEAFPTSNLFQRGHRLRVDISSSNFPHFDANPNSGEAEGFAEHPRVATNRLHLDRTRPSHVLLPVIPARR
ncbi:CocE/NonD family hydrolase [Rudaea cellulosilytica]|uniref:CocE/NonD family hydrolase n=1 Tax=Rudaea cellulosilytica TaxID=540746 RepID=UPI000361000B|nr:CocE/NonD family hydrolase [Rudaea cellulosilytica]